MAAPTYTGTARRRPKLRGNDKVGNSRSSIDQEFANLDRSSAIRSWLEEFKSAAAAANRRIAEADVAAAALLQAAGDRLAAGLQDLPARFVAADAGDTAAVFGVLARANAAGEVALADGNAVERAAAAAKAPRKHLAEVLQGAAGDF